MLYEIPSKYFMQVAVGKIRVSLNSDNKNRYCTGVLISP